MFLTRKDIAGAAIAALTVLIYAANVTDTWYLGSERWAAVTILGVGAVGCSVGSRLVGEKPSVPIVLLGLTGVVALAFGVLAIVTAARWALLGLTVMIVALWAGTTLRHALTAPPRLASQ